MTEFSSKSIRAARAEKAKRLANGASEKVDASDFTPAEPLNAEAKTGERPVSRRQFKRGGHVKHLKAEGEAAHHHAGRKPRKAGGIVNEYQNRDARGANQEIGKPHEGGYKRGGRLCRDTGGANPVPTSALNLNGRNITAGAQGVVPRKDGGRTSRHPDEAEDKALVKRMVKKDALREPRKAGGSANWIHDAIGKPGALHRELHVPEGEKIPAKKLKKAEHSDNPLEAKRAHLAETLKGLGHKDGGRAARKSGGRTKGKTNIVIAINPHGQSDQAQQQGAPMQRPPAPPAAPVPVAPAAPAAMPVPMASSVSPSHRNFPPRTSQPWLQHHRWLHFLSKSLTHSP